MQLQEILNLENKNTLLSLAKVYELKGAYKLKKAELCTDLAEAMCKNIDKGLEKLLPNEQQFFEELVNIEEIPLELENMEMYTNLLVLRLIYIRDEKYVAVSEEIKTAYKEISHDLDKIRALKDKQVFEQKILNYSLAAMNLYGMMPLKDFVKLYCEYEEIQPTEEEISVIIDTIYNQSNMHNQSFVLGDYLLDESWDGVEPEEILYFQTQVQNKPYYRPDKETFLRYVDEYYSEETEELKQVKTILYNKFPLCHKAIQEVIEDWQSFIRIEILPTTNGIGMLMEGLEACDLIFDSKEEIQKFTDAVVQAQNNTRMWINRGGTPKETRIIMAPCTNKVKVGRNDLCPCGSGKKYKKCCGE